MLRSHRLNNLYPIIDTSMTEDTKKQHQHKKAMEKQKAKVDASIEAATQERGIAILLTGNGKGKTSSAFGMAIRALGYGQKVGIVQFIKGAQNCGEATYLRNNCPDVNLQQMGTGFTWNTQDRSTDITAAEHTWEYAKNMLRDDQYDLVILDELTYMLGYKYLDKDTVIEAIEQRPLEQSVVVTGRGGGSQLRDIMDTVSEVKDIKHGFKAGLKARAGVDY